MEERRNLTTMTTIAVKTIVVVESMRDMNITITMAKIVAKTIVAMESTMDMNIIITTIKTIAAMMIVAVESIKNTSITISTLRVWLRKRYREERYHNAEKGIYSGES